MFDLAAKDVRHQRVAGRAAVSFGRDARLERLAQAGSAKAMMPRMHGRAPEIVFLNTAGGLTGGDRLDYAVTLEGGHAVATTQTAERAYRAAQGVAQVATRLTLGPGAELHWLPQELILFDGAALDRRLEVEMARHATLVMLEVLVLGRAAMGETVRHLHLRDHRQVSRNGRPVMIEAIRLDDEDLARDGVAGLDGATAIASLTLLSPDAEDRLPAIRAALPGDGPVRAAASAWDGRLTVRFLSADAFALRRAVARAVSTLTRRPLPRVWQI
jgi:urease accessory protein